MTSQGERFQEKTDYRSYFAKFNIAGEQVLALLPLTYMNRSGEAVAKVANFFKVETKDIIVLHDELDIASCTFRLKRHGGHGGHNGLRSIHPLGDEYLRIRLGIGRPPHSDIDVADYVLGNFTLAERKTWEQLYPAIAEALQLCVAGKELEAMNHFNAKSKAKGDSTSE